MSDAPAQLKVLVLVKHVPDAQFDRHLAGESPRLDRQESILSELDEYAVEAALQLIEAHGGAKAGHEVTVLTMGPDAASNAVKKSLQMGATQGLHLNDAALAGSDAAATSLALAAAIRATGDYHLILTGMSSTDGETSLVPSQLAERLGLPQLTLVSSLEVDGAEVRAQRDADGQTQHLRASLPALVSVTDQFDEPRYPNFKGIMGAKKKKTTALTVADIGLTPDQVGTAGSLAVAVSAEERPARQGGTVITDQGDAGVKLADFLADQKLL
ncbi:electron transfer flavoprotein subunit beta/FixA family protein [Zhihengliuella flava]|uniref:Electron transfer flavoprotein subunit beta n=1 Tax=Zhihengliuella flava TaxID=1285193 RepID=A0A931DDJ5_9MICC|nr:electron transfer flavoprotein subunit beta/FixA family protein [Zhihengliuella flava]MBG6085591.1 electron transfer flavoprotein beta subunit [Zhihengliuella flava]